MRGTGERGGGGGGGVADPWKKGHWTAEEDKQLMQVVATCGEGQWNKLAKAAGLLRCGKSCRLRWVNYLRPGVKRGQISDAEERLIIQLHGLFGRRWSVIAAHLPGRSDNEIKNYWRSHVRKKVKSNRDYYLYHGGPAMAAALAAVEKEEADEAEAEAEHAETRHLSANISVTADTDTGTGTDTDDTSFSPSKKKTAKTETETETTLAALNEKPEAFNSGSGGRIICPLAPASTPGIGNLLVGIGADVDVAFPPAENSGGRSGDNTIAILQLPAGNNGGCVPDPCLLASVASEISCLSPRSSSSGSHIEGFGGNRKRSSGSLSGFGEDDGSNVVVSAVTISVSASASSSSSSSSSSSDNISGFGENGGKRNGSIPGYGENDNISGYGEDGRRSGNISGYGEDCNISGVGENGGRIEDISGYREDGNISGFGKNGGKIGNISGVGENGGRICNISCHGEDGNISGIDENGGRISNISGASKNGRRICNISGYGEDGNISGIGKNGRRIGNISGYDVENDNIGGRNGSISGCFGKYGNVSVDNISGIGENGGRNGDISGFGENRGRNGDISGFGENGGRRNSKYSSECFGFRKSGEGSKSGPTISVANDDVKACLYSSPSSSSSSSLSLSSLSSFSDLTPTWTLIPTPTQLPVSPELPEHQCQSLSGLAEATGWLRFPDSPLLSFSWDIQSCLEIASPLYDSDYDPDPSHPLSSFSDHLWS